MSALRAGVARFGSMIRSIQGVGGMMGKISDGWNGVYGAVADGWEMCMEYADMAWDYTRDAAVHVAQDVDKAVGFTAQAAIHVGQDFGKVGKEFAQTMGAAGALAGKFAWNNPVSKIARNIGAFMIEDKRPRLEANKGAKKDAVSAVEKAKSANPAELAALKAAYIKDDPEQIERYVGAENKHQKDAAFKAMSPKAQAWISELGATEIWSLKGKSSTEIAAHLAGDKTIAGVADMKDYYGATKTAAPAPKPEAPKAKTAAENSADRKAKKVAKRDAANGVTPAVAGTVTGQAPEPQPSPQQEMMQFFGPRVAKEEEVSEYSQSQLPAYRPPVPRKAG
ncbi:hypothetical protein [Agrobacterium pusense]|uniref:hypothetical protein n=1 Tax=Agrobacterium pusense TaxID=648995 RepID=UPI000D3D406C|nr:hypothetical protein [Agrobacterium pusense]PTV70171.1 hypothetical protein DBL06_25240 [Agrobacterium pusense]